MTALDVLGRVGSLRTVRSAVRRVGRLASDLVPDRIVLSRRFRQELGYRLSLRHPRTWNEKLFWMLLYYRSPLVTQLADKYAVREYVAARGLARILNDCYGTWSSADAIDFAALPQAFVLKVAWGWNMNILCRDKRELDILATRRTLDKWLARNHYWTFREWPYKHVPRRIFSERYLVDPVWPVPPDYKIFCFGGEPEFVQIDTNRFSGHTRDMVGVNWAPVPFTFDRFPPSGVTLPRPDNWEEMLAVARTLAHGLPFVRVDLYSVDGRTVFGEMTWIPEAGTGLFHPDEYNTYWGDRIPLPE